MGALYTLLLLEL